MKPHLGKCVFKDPENPEYFSPAPPLGRTGRTWRPRGSTPTATPHSAGIMWPAGPARRRGLRVARALPPKSRPLPQATRRGNPRWLPVRASFQMAVRFPGFHRSSPQLFGSFADTSQAPELPVWPIPPRDQVHRGVSGDSAGAAISSTLSTPGVGIGVRACVPTRKM